MRAAQSDLDGCATLRESACGVLAAMLQNNPPVQSAARGMCVGQVLLRLLGVEDQWCDRWETRAGGLPVVRKALLALSAMLRGDEEIKSATDGSGGAQGRDGAVGDSVLEAALPALCVLAGHPDLKLRRRTLFLLASLVSDSADARALTFSSATHGGSSLPSALVSALFSRRHVTRLAAALSPLRGAVHSRMVSPARFSTVSFDTLL